MASSAVPPATLICVGRPLAGSYWYSTVRPSGSVTFASCPEAVYSYAVYALELALSYRRVVRPPAARAWGGRAGAASSYGVSARELALAPPGALLRLASWARQRLWSSLWGSANRP